MSKIILNIYFDFSNICYKVYLRIIKNYKSIIVFIDVNIF